jgi:hypothetical protein
MLLIAAFFTRGTHILSAFHNKVDKHTMGSHDSAVGRTTRLRAGQLSNCDWILLSGKTFLSSPKCPDGLCYPPILLFSG